jgi:hypothetical protein
MTRDSRNEVRGGKIGSNLSPIPPNPLITRVLILQLVKK